MRIGPLTDVADEPRWAEIYTAGRGGPPAFEAGCGRFAAWSQRGLIGAAEVRRDVGTETFARVYVDPSARRSGAGRGLVAAVSEWASDHGGTLVKAIVSDDDSEAFAVALGADVAIRLVTVVHDLDTAPEIPAPPGLRLLRWDGPAPEELLDAYALLRRTVGEAPDAQLQMDVAARTREWERERTASGNQLWVCAAMDGHDLIGFTEVEVPEAGPADQHDTAVLPAWRGRSVATWLKADMLGWIRRDRPGVTSISSSINLRNEPMLRVCDRLGFHRHGQRTMVVLPVHSSGA
jgi:GNAT superfamily N-acetyltransferase